MSEADTEGTDGDRGRSDSSFVALLGFLDRHTGLIASAAGVMFFAMRLLVVTYGDLDSVAIIVRETSLAVLIVQAVATLLPLAVMAAGAFALALLRYAWRKRNLELATVGALVALGAIAAGGFVVPIGILIPAGLGFATGMYLLHRGVWFNDEADGEPAMRNGVWVAIVLIANLVAVTAMLGIWTDPWWPAEEITVGAEEIAAWVISEDGESVIAMTSETREIVRIPRASIESRTFCSITSDSLMVRTVASLRERQNRLPECLED